MHRAPTLAVGTQSPVRTLRRRDAASSSSLSPSASSLSSDSLLASAEPSSSESPPAVPSSCTAHKSSLQRTQMNVRDATILSGVQLSMADFLECLTEQGPFWPQ